MESQTIEHIARVASEVASADAALRDARAEELAAEAELLTRVRDTALPGLRAAARPILLAHRVSGLARDTQRSSSRHAGARGIELVEGLCEDAPRANEGAYEGTSLVLVTHEGFGVDALPGVFVAIEWSGSWSRWQGATSHYEGTPRAMTPFEVVERFGLVNVLGGMTRALNARLAELGKRAPEKARERATRLAAVAQLLGGAR